MEWSFVFFSTAPCWAWALQWMRFRCHGKRPARPPHEQGDHVQDRGHLCPFQAVMPMTGWVCVHTIVEMFSSFETFIPWIALALLGYIGGKMLVDGIRGEEAEEAAELSAGALLMQGVATSIDALSVGFTIRSTAG